MKSKKSEKFSHWIVVVPHRQGEYRDPEGARVNIHRFPKSRTVHTMRTVHKGTTIADFADQNGYQRIVKDQPIPSDTPFFEELSADDRFATVRSLAEHSDQLTDIKGIGDAYAADIIGHITDYQKKLNSND